MRYRFGAFELDADQYELREGSRVVRVEPRVLDVLCFLIRNRDRVVTKEELLDNVWKTRYIGESALSRCIMQARKAIAQSDGGEEPIKTLHRRGFRFVAPVIEVATEERPADAPPPDPEPPVAHPEAAAPTILEESVVADSPAPGETKLAGVIRRRRIPLFAAAVLAVLLMIALQRTQGFTGRASEGTSRLAILPVSASDDEPETLLLASMFSDVLSIRLANVPGLVVRTPTESSMLSMSMGTLSQLADRAGVNFVLSGSLRRVTESGKARVDLTLHKFGPAGRVETTSLGHYDIPFIRNRADVKQLRVINDGIVERVIRELRPLIETSVASGDTPNDPYAYRLYLLGRDRLSEQKCDSGGSLELLERSLELDPNFAPAWQVLALAHYGRASSCGDDSSHYQKALAGITRALELHPQMPGAMALKATVLAETGRVEEAYESLMQQKNGGGRGDPEIDYAASAVLCYAGYLGDARRKLDQVLSSDPQFLTMGGWAPDVHLYAADPERFLRYLPATETASFRYYRGYAQILQGRVDPARATLSPAFRLNPQDMFGRLSTALLAIVDGKSVEALEILRGLERQRAAVGSSDGGLTYKVAQLYERAGDHDSALTTLNRAVDQGFFCAPCFASDPLWTPLRTRPQFIAAAHRAEERHRSFGRRFGLVAAVN